MEGKAAGAPAQAVVVGAAPAAQKRHEVGRVARRARPVITGFFGCRPRLTVKAGHKEGFNPGFLESRFRKS